jgi:hypothetical protein
LRQWCEAPFDAIGVVAFRIKPKDNRRAGMKELAGDYYLVPDAIQMGARFGNFGASGNKNNEERD